MAIVIACKSILFLPNIRMNSTWIFNFLISCFRSFSFLMLISHMEPIVMQEKRVVDIFMLKIWFLFLRYALICLLPHFRLLWLGYLEHLISYSFFIVGAFSDKLTFVGVQGWGGSSSRGNSPGKCIFISLPRAGNAFLRETGSLLSLFYV